MAMRVVMLGAQIGFDVENPPEYSEQYGFLPNNYKYIYGLNTHIKSFNSIRIFRILEVNFFFFIKNCFFLHNFIYVLFFQDCTTILTYLIEKTTFFHWLMKKCPGPLYQLYIKVGGLLVKHSCQFIINGFTQSRTDVIMYDLVDKHNQYSAFTITSAMLNHSCDSNMIYA